MRAKRPLGYSTYSTQGSQSGLGSTSSPTRQVARPFPAWRAALSSPAGGARGLGTSAKRRRWGSEMGWWRGGPPPAPGTAPVGSTLWFLLSAGRGPWVQPALLPWVGLAVRRAGRCAASRLRAGSLEQMGGGRPASLRQQRPRGAEAGPGAAGARAGRERLRPGPPRPARHVSSDCPAGGSPEVEPVK